MWKKLILVHRKILKALENQFVAKQELTDDTMSSVCIHSRQIERKYRLRETTIGAFTRCSTSWAV